MWPGVFLYSEHNGASIYEIDIFIFRRFDSFGLLWVQQNIICDLKRGLWGYQFSKQFGKILSDGNIENMGVICFSTISLRAFFSGHRIILYIHFPRHVYHRRIF